MSDDLQMAIESFLMEDVILTLGNVRSSLGWIGANDAGVEPAQHRVGIDRLGRQIELLEDRARDVCRQLRAAGATAEQEAQAFGACTGAGDAAGGSDAPLLPCDPFAPAISTESFASCAADPERDALSIETAILDALHGDRDRGQSESPVFRSKRG
ncbi:hypothetical protein DEA8626_02276 [Defluviimonas aquaemixtae]|uniref:Uncharacterized protein n=1 Tax=Albidovulum aquaemixtae TaxID=1542388 RepID=A0A2R8B7Y6_9RHOB|nr:hypothetical protein [Defluviimonas aquaemixtae]SPH18734.1 hypothetical protein DEA8626_02276 [Defluviimonas aquaemixtae]